MNLNDLLRLIRRFRVLAAAVLLVVIAAGVIAAVVPADRYSSTATVIADPTIGPDGQVGAVQQIDFLVPQYLARIGSRGFLSVAGAPLTPSVQRAPISISPSGEPGTGIISIEVTSTQRNAVAPWAAALAKTLIATSEKRFATLTLIDEPVTPSSPYAPNRLFVVGISVLLALLASLLSVVLAAALRAPRDGAAEIRERFGMRVLAEIPTLPRRLAAHGPAEFGAAARAGGAVDALQTLRANVSFLLADRPHPWVAVVSARAREGKTFVAVHLSWLLSGMGAETLLLDANARHPTAHTLLGLSPVPGIDEIHVGSLAAVAQRSMRPHLRFVGSGRPELHPAEVASARLPVLLDQLTDQNVTLVVDTPPMAGTAEALTYAVGCGAVLFVIDARRRDFPDVEQMLLTLNDRRVDVLGVVINRSRRNRWRERTLGRRRLAPVRDVDRAAPGNGWPGNGAQYDVPTADWRTRR